MPYRKFTKQFKGVQKGFSIYWNAYGGFWSLIQSPYLFVAFIVSLLSIPLLSKTHTTTWYEISLSSLPDLLGFTLGGYAILLAFGNERFLGLLAGRGEDEEHSGFMAINATFVHFILVQVLAILFALIGTAWQAKSGLFAFVGLLTFTYSILTAVAAAMSVLRLSNLFDDWMTHQNKKKEKAAENTSL